MREIKKMIRSVLLGCLLFSSLILSVSAAQSIPAERQRDRLDDGAGLLNSREAAKLLQSLDEISERQACDVVIVTTDSLQGKTATEFAEDFFDYNGYGIGEDDDGILFLISIEDRDWAISTNGFGITAFTDAGQEYIIDEILPMLRENDFAAAFGRFTELADELLTQARSGVPYDVTDQTNPQMPYGQLSRISSAETKSYSIIHDKEFPGQIAGSLVISLLLAFIPVSIMKSTHKSIHPKNQADAYIREGSFRITGSNEMFLYRQISKTRIERQSSSGGGGSRTHTSSSGRTHGGSSGKF